MKTRAQAERIVKSRSDFAKVSPRGARFLADIG
jgi:hypothetical protein